MKPLLPALLLCLLPGTETAKLAFAPEPGTVLDKSFVTLIRLEGQELEVKAGGEVVDPSSMFEEEFDPGELRAACELVAKVTDTYAAVAGGRPTDLLRRVHTLAVEYDGGFGETGSWSDEELEGSTIRMRWDPETGAYRRSVEEGDAEHEALARLAPDLDLLGLLPDPSLGWVEPGASWARSWAELRALVVPGLELDAAAAAIAASSRDSAGLRAFLTGPVAGPLAAVRATLTFRGTREVGGRSCGVVGFESVVPVQLDLLPLTESVLAHDELEFGALTADLSIDLSGELLWDLQGGHLHSLELVGLLEGTLATAFTVQVDARELELEARLEIAGAIQQSVGLE